MATRVESRRVPATGGDAAFTHRQATPSATWTVDHRLNTRPHVVLVLDSNPDEAVYTDVTYPDLDTAVIEWPAAETGWAHCR